MAARVFNHLFAVMLIDETSRREFDMGQLSIALTPHMGERTLMVVEAQLLSVVHAAHVSSHLSLVNDTLIPSPHDVRAMIPVSPE